MAKLEYLTFKDHADWLELRRHSIGGSDAAIIAGQNPFSSPTMLYLDKLGQVPERPQSEAARQGTDLEEYVARRFMEQTGKKVHKVNYTIKNSDYPFAHANIDRKVTGENAGLECKTTSQLNMKKFKDGEYPANYYVQCQHYMAITGYDKFYLAVLIYSKDFLVFEIERDDDFINSLMTLESDFWKHVQNEQLPDADGSPATDEALNLYFTDPSDETISIFGMNEVADELYFLKQQVKQSETRIRQIQQEFRQYMDGCAYGETDAFRITCKPQVRRTFQSKKFMQDHPEIDFEPYYKESISHPFYIKELEANK